LISARRVLALAALVACVVAAAVGVARAQPVDEPLEPRIGSQATVVPPGANRYKSPQRFAIEVRFGPYLPDVDSEFDGARHPYRDFFGTSQKLLSQIEFDYELFHRFGTVAVGAAYGYFSVSAPAPVANGGGATSNDLSTMTVLPFSVSAIYRFDVFLERNRFPLVPFAKAGLNYAYWSITDGNDAIATDATGGKGRGGTLGWHGAVGLQLVLDFFDWDAARSFDADMGVNHTSLVFQYTYADISGLGMSNRMHLGDANWSLGIMFQF
jgi:hypothetical protein